MKKSLVFLLALFVVGCNLFHKRKSPYQGYSTNDGITHFKFSDLATGHKKPKPGDMLEVVLSYSKMNDSVFWTTRDKGYPFSRFYSYKDLAGGSTYQRHLLECAEGDSINYIVPADSVFKSIFKMPLPFFLHTGDMMRVNARITGAMDSTRYASRLKTVKDYLKDMDMQEQVTLSKYISANNIPDSCRHNGMYVIHTEAGKGPKIEMGSMVSLAYKGSFLSGRVFDSVSANNPLQFKYGDTDQMISGMAIAIKTMSEGGKTKIIIPSQLAFGENGSSTGIVPPYTTVVYEVTVLKVINGPVTKN
jgi:FKBP-type peptidyl-prolyl cis-trans isomerase